MHDSTLTEIVWIILVRLIVVLLQIKETEKQIKESQTSPIMTHQIRKVRRSYKDEVSRLSKRDYYKASKISNKYEKFSIVKLWQFEFNSRGEECLKSLALVILTIFFSKPLYSEINNIKKLK